MVLARRAPSIVALLLRPEGVDDGLPLLVFVFVVVARKDLADVQSLFGNGTGGPRLVFLTAPTQQSFLLDGRTTMPNDISSSGGPEDHCEGTNNHRLNDNNRQVTLGGRRNTILVEYDCTAADAVEYEEVAPEEQQHHLIAIAEPAAAATAVLGGAENRNLLHQLPKEMRNVLAGGIAGIVAKSVVAPVDRIKIMYQISNVPFRFLDVPSVAKKIIQSDGLAGLWKGNTAAMIRVFPYSGIQFMAFDVCKQYILERRELHQQELHHAHELSAANDDDHDRSDHDRPQRRRHQPKGGLSPTESLVAGMVAGSVSVLCTYPLDLTRAQLAVLKKTSQRQTFVTILRENHLQRGVTGLFRGIVPTLIGILPYSGIAFALNEQGKRQVGFHRFDVPD
jgi:hypothetical protein